PPHPQDKPYIIGLARRRTTGPPSRRVVMDCRKLYFATMQFSLWQVLVLAVVQGIAEFLPVSSSGHLVVLTPWLFGSSAVPPDMLTVNIALHLGTLGSILVYYWRRILRLLGEDRRVVGLLIVGTMPAGVIG